MKKEIWTKIKTDPIYSVSSYGNIRNDITNKIKSTRLDRYGYPRVTLYPSGKTYTIHQLVLKNFTDKEVWKETVNHIDGNKQNNNLDNLEWNTVKENIQHKHSIGLNANVNGMNNPMSKLCNEDVYDIRFNYPTLSCSELAEAYNMSSSAIERIRSGRGWKHITKNMSINKK